MNPSVIQHLRCPIAGSSLALRRVQREEAGRIHTGELVAEKTGRVYQIKNCIPRFVNGESYTTSFGEQWNRYRRTQLDRFNGLNLSRERLLRDTRWKPEELRGQRILEAGCGAGRFTEILLDAGAELYAIDSSTAVDACRENNGANPSLFLAQADLEKMPFKDGFFDRVFCYGVLQHTEDVKQSFLSLLPVLKSGGQIAVDVYLKTPWTTRWTSKFWYRPITKRMSRERLRKIIEWYIPRWITVDNFLQRIPILRRIAPIVVPCWNYTGMLPLTNEQIIQWAILDTFDALSPAYDSPQTIFSVQSWFEEAGLLDIDIRLGGNGILGNAVKP
jgi:ubiquinone/menaquinone biosynthesis C-methylase UbiE/uncharacterized protein YbaR (Trm112 family)